MIGADGQEPEMPCPLLLIQTAKKDLFMDRTTKAKSYIQLHLNIALFSLTSLFAKLASIQLNQYGLKSKLLYLFLFLMIANCGVYALCWQQVIKKFSLSTAYANKSVYILWTQVWAVVILHESLSVRNIIGMLVIIIGVIVVAKYE